MEILRISSNKRHLVVDLFNRYRVFYNQDDNQALADNYIKDRLENNESIIFVALEERDGKETPIGFTQLYPTYSSVRAMKNWILNDLFVDEQHRSKGAGKQLIAAVVEFAKNQDAKFVQLETGFENFGAQKLYETLGFIKQKPSEEYYIYQLEIS